MNKKNKRTVNNGKDELEQKSGMKSEQSPQTDKVDTAFENLVKTKLPVSPDTTVDRKRATPSGGSVSDYLNYLDSLTPEGRESYRQQAALADEVF